MDDREDPFYRLQPVKVEELHNNPTIIMFHDIISPKEMKIIRFAAAPLVCMINGFLNLVDKFTLSNLFMQHNFLSFFSKHIIMLDITITYESDTLILWESWHFEIFCKFWRLPLNSLSYGGCKLNRFGKTINIHVPWLLYMAIGL